MRNALRLGPIGLCLGAAMSMSISMLAGCRGDISEKPPRHMFDDMDWQAKFQPEGESPFFADGRAMRPLIAGTVARGELRDNEAAGGFYTGKLADAFLTKVPFPVDEHVLRRGQERFNIYCAPCHDKTGSGHGTVIERGKLGPGRGFSIPIDLASEHPRTIGDGEIFSYISNGIRNMPAYRVQIPEKDRWAIVSWVRVLQRSQHARPDDVPAGQTIEADPSSTQGPAK